MNVEELPLEAIEEVVEDLPVEKEELELLPLDPETVVEDLPVEKEKLELLPLESEIIVEDLPVLPLDS